MRGKRKRSTIVRSKPSAPRRGVVPSQKTFLENHLETLLPLMRGLRSLSRAYTEGFVWEPAEGDWVLHVNPETGEERLRMVWTVATRAEDNGHAENKYLVFEISFPEDRYDELIDVGEFTDCLFLPTERQCWEWLQERECCIELSRVGDATEVRPIMAVPRIPPIHHTPLHALYTVICAILDRPALI